MVLALLLPLLAADVVDIDTFDTARRLMLEGDLARAVPLLESLLAAPGSDDRSRAGFLLEALDQSAMLSSADSILAAAASEPDPPRGTAAIALAVIPGEEGGWMLGRYGITLSLPAGTIDPGDSVAIWIPLAESTAIQDPESPSWEAGGLRPVSGIVLLGEPGTLPALHLSGIAGDDPVTVSLEQGFTAYGAAAPVRDPGNLVLAVPGLDPEVDRALASGTVIPTGGAAGIVARRIGGSDPDPLARLGAILGFAMDSLEAGPVPWALYAFEGIPGSVAGSGRADGLCLAVFTAAVCRVNGIPCRVTGGWSSSPGGPVRHSRIECLLEEGSWTPFDPTMARAAARDGLDGGPFLSGFCDAARVCTFASVEDTLSPGKRSWITAPPGSFPEVETRAPGGAWTALPLRTIAPATTVSLTWRE